MCSAPPAPGQEFAHEYTYDPGNPTPYLVDARELELSINENYQAVHAERKDLLDLHHGAAGSGDGDHRPHGGDALGCD